MSASAAGRNAGALGGFTRIREVAETFMDKRDRAGDGWQEEAVTAVAVTEGRPHVEVVEFNRNQEGRGPAALGADYLWWWIDSATGECFGMLVQAKRLKHSRGDWTVDVSHREGKQLRDLIRTADVLQVPAVYSVYTGGLVFRESLPCRHDEGTPGERGDATSCLPCRRAAITMITGYQLSSCWYAPRVTAELVLSEGIPVEDLVDPAVPSPPVRDVNLRDLTDPQLRDFLMKPQGGAREIARRIFRHVANHRSQQFSAATAELVPVDGAPIFSEVPEDTGHFPGAYYPHVLQGLRSSAPAYIEALRQPAPDQPWGTSGYMSRMTAADWGGPVRRRPPPELRDANLGGVVLVTL